VGAPVLLRKKREPEWGTRIVPQDDELKTEAGCGQLLVFIGRWMV
jgi:hypothetical protein